MERFVIDGNVRLEGAVRVHGSKNAVLPMLAASVLNKGISVIENVPMISDMRSMLDILRLIGCKCTLDEGILVIDSGSADVISIDEAAASKVRTSVLFCGSMLGRFGRASVAEPGGCAIGRRPIDIHLEAFRRMGAEISRKDGRLEIKAARLNGIDYELPFPSVGATQNIMMAATGAYGTTIIRNAAREPEVYELGVFLKSMGVRAEGMGTDTVVITGRSELNDTAHVLAGDRIVAGTYMAACAAAGGRILLKGVSGAGCRGFLEIFENMGCRIEAAGDEIIFEKNIRLFNPCVVETGPFPAFPTDMQSQLMSVMCLSAGEGRIVENVFENRYKNAAELAKMGADIDIVRNVARIRGKPKLSGAVLTAHDLRGGAALIVAGLGADGRTVVEDAGYVGRGYEDIRRDLCLLGAHMA